MSTIVAKPYEAKVVTRWSVARTDAGLGPTARVPV